MNLNAAFVLLQFKKVRILIGLVVLILIAKFLWIWNVLKI